MRLCRATTAVLLVLGTGFYGTVGVMPAFAQAAQSQEPERKLDFEVRAMFWADSAERQSLPDQDGRITDFFVRRARLILQGRPTESVSFYLQVGQDNIGAKLLTEDGSIRIKDAYINYGAVDGLQAVVGQFKIPFLRANLESGFNQLLVDRGVLPTLRPSREGSRDLGVMVWGNMQGFQYRAALFDGSDQETRNAETHLRGSGRVAYNWFTRETGLGYTGTSIAARRVVQLAAQIDAQSSRLDQRDDANFQALPRDYRAYALEGYVEQPFAGPWTLTGEAAWFDRRDDYLEPGTATRTLKGYYAQAGVLLPVHIGPGRLQPAFRREDWETDRGPQEETTTRNTVGVTYFISGHDRKVQADYTWKGETVEIANDELRISVVLVFQEEP
jgi:hypothetical protein